MGVRGCCELPVRWGLQCGAQIVSGFLDGLHVAGCDVACGTDQGEFLHAKCKSGLGNLRSLVSDYDGSGGAEELKLSSRTGDGVTPIPKLRRSFSTNLQRIQDGILMTD